MRKQDPDTLSSIVLTFRLGNKNPVERKALEYLQACEMTGENKRDVIARALAAAADNHYQSQQLAAQNEEIANQLQRLIDQLQSGAFTAGRQNADSPQGVGGVVGEELKEHMQKIVGTIRRAGDVER